MVCLSVQSLTRTLHAHQLLGLLIRLVLIAYGDYHDTNNSVPYTDIDYHVITDGARHVTEGRSPFIRHTYRYTPLLAWVMTPNVLIHETVGKIIFSLLDCITTQIIYKILILQGQSASSAVKCSLLWLYNPLVIGIATRGSAESLIIATVMLVLYSHECNRFIVAGALLGTAIHIKIYPIIYSLPLYLSLEPLSGRLSWKHFCPTYKRTIFVISTGISFMALTLFSFGLYGREYIEEGFLYHVTRVDTRHNFSIYFYLLYLSTNYTIPGLGIACFAPQMMLVVAYGVMYGSREHLALAMFAQTVVFVTFNKVVTSQYFMWYLVFVPVLCTQLSVSKRKGLTLLILWIGAQASWLLPAYLFEFKGIEVFTAIWLESVAFFCCNIGILMAVISGYWAAILAKRNAVKKSD